MFLKITDYFQVEYETFRISLHHCFVYTENVKWYRVLLMAGLKMEGLLS